MAIAFNVIYLNFFVLFVSGIDVPGLEDMNQCNPHDVDCIINHQDPTVRKWFADGQPNYDIPPLDPLKLKQLNFNLTNGHQYIIDKPKIEGVTTLNMLFWRFDLQNNKLTYIHEYNLDVKAKHILDKDGRCVVEEPKIRIAKVLVTVQHTMYLERTDSGDFLRVPEIVYKSVSDGKVKIKDEVKNIDRKDRPEFKKVLSKTIVEATSEQLMNAWFQFQRNTPATVYYGPVENWYP